MARTFARFFDIPYDAVTAAPRLTVTDGRAVLAENCGELLEYTGEEIRFSSGVCIRGGDLSISMMRRDEVLISGLIAGVEWG